jgi:hypothetical protein
VAAFGRLAARDFDACGRAGLAAFFARAGAGLEVFLPVNRRADALLDARFAAVRPARFVEALEARPRTAFLGLFCTAFLDRAAALRFAITGILSARRESVSSPRGSLTVYP